MAPGPTPRPPDLRRAEAARRGGRLAEAEAIYRARLVEAPDDPRALHGLAIVALQTGHPGPAAGLLQRAAARGATADLLVDLGLALGLVGDRASAIAAELRAVELDPRHAQARYNLACDLQAENRLAEAIAQYRHATRLAPGHVDAWNNLAQALVAAGEIAEGLAAFDRAERLAPADAALAGNRLLALHYDPGRSPAAIAAEHRRWGERHVRPAPPLRHLNPPDPDRPLRIGFVSPDFCRHPIGWFVTGPLAHRDRARFHVTAYSSRRAEDDLTAAIRGLVDRWRPVAGLDDGALAAQVRSDGIDILVDLAGHTMGNRLGAFARRPAPVQATWLGWIDTTGHPAIDWCIADRIEAPPGEEDRFTERVIRLEGGAMCYAPPADAPATVAPPLTRGAAPTFGCFNNLSKVNARVVALWARLLAAVPAARLLLKSKALGDPAVAGAMAARFAAHGIDGDRLILEGRSPHGEMLARYGDVDVALDPFPYSGGLTTVEALWMGVPVVTLAGDRMVARQTAGFLDTLGRTEWIAPSGDAYVATAAALVADRAGLSAARAGQRARMAATPLVDGARFTPMLEAAFRAMWQDWCRRQAPG
ncbi:tetratricopeptide repeat protein [Stella sp.]|uniref:O-linked N-acetylglucosamine transferase, SPINDLY family protein n=1 Tax=Stella sp. TaxID=2912054 RepID=UPI0035B3F1E0